jgi:hypothetical protein
MVVNLIHSFGARVLVMPAPVMNMKSLLKISQIYFDYVLAELRRSEYFHLVSQMVTAALDAAKYGHER